MKFFSLWFLILFSSNTLLAETPGKHDWPQWQGSNRNAISKEKGLLGKWPKEGPRLAWKVTKLGGGDSTPSIAAGRIFGMSNRGENEVVWALSEKDGTELWVTKLGPAYKQRMNQSSEGPGATPTVDGEYLYVEGMAGNVACLKVADGTLVWQRSLQKEFGGGIPMWSFRESPLVDGDKVIVTPGGKDATLVALNKLTGETIWKSVLPDAPAGEAPRAAGESDRGGPGGGSAGRSGPGRGEPGRGGPGRGGFSRGGARAGAAYASPISIEAAGQKQYVQLTAKSLIGVSATDGKLLWRYDRPANHMGVNCSTPIYQDGLVFAASAYGNGGGAVKLQKNEDGSFKAEEVYFSSAMQNHHGGMIVHDGCLYGANGGNGGGFLSCLDFQTGKVLWRDRKAEKGSLAMADGRLYLRTESGSVILIQPSKEKLIELGRFEQPNRTSKPAWAHPVIANGKLYIRDHDLLLCYDVTK